MATGQVTFTTEHAALCQVIGVALRHHRNRFGLGLSDLAAMLKCSQSRASRIESGLRGIRPSEVEFLLDEFAVEGQERDTLLALASWQCHSRAWWHEFKDFVPVGLRACLSLEVRAASIAIYSPLQVPALLQTPAYARATIAAVSGTIGTGVSDQAEALALIRQSEVLQGNPRPQMTVVLGEGALRQETGDRTVMSEQIARLAHIAATDDMTTVQVLPFTSRSHPILTCGSVTVLGFAAPPYLDSVHLDGPDGGICLIGSQHARRYDEAMVSTRFAALTPSETLRLLDRSQPSTMLA